MITAVDTNVLLDVFTEDATFVRASSGALRECMAAGALIGCEVVWAELGGAFESPGRGAAALARLGVRFVPMDAPAALDAGHMWREYRRLRESAYNPCGPLAQSAEHRPFKPGVQGSIP